MLDYIHLGDVDDRDLTPLPLISESDCQGVFTAIDILRLPPRA